jgi:hypothetical protein
MIVDLGACQERSTGAVLPHSADALPREAMERAAEWREMCILARNKRYKHEIAQTRPKRRKNIRSRSLEGFHVTYVGESALASMKEDVVVACSLDLIRCPVKA